ncbi:MAG: RodZ domain-containing protein [Chromatiales bacterium]
MARMRSEVEAEASALTPPEIGVLLRKAREAKGMNAEDVAARLRLSNYVVRILEDGRFESLPAATYARGYLRAYAKLVSIDAAPLVAAYDQYAELPPDIDPYASAPQPQVQATDFPIRAVTYLVVAGLVGLLGTWLWQTHEVSSIASLTMPKWGAEQAANAGADVMNVPGTPSPGTPPPEVVASAPESPWPGDTYPVIEGEEGALPALAPTEPGIAGATADSRAVTPAPEAATGGAYGAISNLAEPAPGVPRAEAGAQPPAAADTPTVPVDRNVPAAQPPSQSELSTASSTPLLAAASPGDRVLTLELARDAWIEVMDADDKRLYYNLGRQGSRISVQGALPYRVKIGNAEAVAVSYEGRPLEISTFSTNSVARFKVTADGFLVGQ